MRWLLGMILLMCLTGSSLAQWLPLGPQWRTADSVADHAILLNLQDQVLVADIVAGIPRVQYYGGTAWQDLGNGLVGTGAFQCAMGLDAQGRALLALGPQLGLQRCDAGIWSVLGGLPAVTDVQGLQLRVAPGGTLWLAYSRSGLPDSTWVITDNGGGQWTTIGRLRGKVRDLELSETGQPVLLVEGDSALWRRQSGQWQRLPDFLHPEQEYTAIEALLDGADGMVAVRRDLAGDFSVEVMLGGSWQGMGAEGFAHGDEHDLALGRNGIAHFAVADHSSQGPPQVFQFVAGSWQTLGGQFAYNNTVTRPELSFDGATAYLLYRDSEQADQGTVLYYGNPQALGDVATMRVALSPVPASRELHLSWEHPMPVGSILEVVDVLGRSMARWPVAGRLGMDCDVASLPEGSYWVRLVWPDGRQQSNLFLKLD